MHYFLKFSSLFMVAISFFSAVASNILIVPLKKEEGDFQCHAFPFTGIEIDIPIVPLSVLMSPDGIDFKMKSEIEIDFLVFELEPYIEFTPPGNPTSPCLKVEIYNPQWEGSYERFFVNYNKDNTFRVRVKTEEYTEFVFSRDRWIAHPPGESEFVRYDYSTNTLFLDASNGRIEEFEIISEPSKGNNLINFFCVNEIENNSLFANPLKFLIALSQDITNSTREFLFSKIGAVGGGFTIPLIWATGGLVFYTTLNKQKRVRSDAGIVFVSIITFLWTIFWAVVFNAFPQCWN